jgi:tetratricopeptide (TPR) repeat protein
VDEIALSLGMSRAGALVLVDRAHPARLGDLVRTLRHTWPDVEVHAGVESLDQAPAGSALVLVPRAEDAEWLNMRRERFAERKLKVVLWCDEAAAAALARKAVDFFDWISHRQECPPGPAPFAVHGIRAALEARWPVVWTGSDRPEVLEDILRNAVPSEAPPSWLAGSAPYKEIVDGIGGRRVVAVRVESARQLRRVRWAHAEARRASGGVVLVAPGFDCPGCWPVHDRLEDLIHARTRLAQAGASAPGRMAALLDLEPAAIDLATALLGKGLTPEELERAATETMDPGAGLALLAERRGAMPLCETYFLDVQPPVLRALARKPRAREALKKWLHKAPRERKMGALPEGHLGIWAAHETSYESLYDTLEWIGSPSLWSWGLEPSLRAGRAPHAWLDLAAVAAALGEEDVAAQWVREVQRRREHERLIAEDSMEGEPRKTFEEPPSDTVAGAIAALMKPEEPERDPSVTLRRFQEAAEKIERRIEAGRSVTSPLLAFVSRQLQREDSIRSMLGEVDSLVERESYEEAETIARDAVRRASEELGEHHPLCQRAERALISILAHRGRSGEALALIESRLGSSEPENLIVAARTLAGAGRAAEAVAALSWLVKGADPRNGPVAAPVLSPREPVLSPADAPLLAAFLLRPAGSLRDHPSAHLVLVDALLKQGRYPEALTTARDAVQTFLGEDTRPVRTLRERVTDLERRLGSSVTMGAP